MRDIVRERFVDFTAPLEGVVPWLYADVKGLVTTAIGCLVDPVAYALALPFVHRTTGAPATREEIRAEWNRVKGDLSLAKLGHRAAERITDLRLTPEGVEAVVLRKLDENEASLARRYAEWADWPACAQLATHSLAWACGAAYAFPRLDAALAARDFLAAAAECQMRTEGNPGLRPRNKANAHLFRNAMIVQGAKLDPDTLVWDRDLDLSPLASEPGPLPCAALADTLPELPASNDMRVIHPVVDTVTEAQRRDE